MKKIRLAKVEDIHQLLEIYSPYILDTTISFETELPSFEEFKKRFLETLEKFPWLVCEIDNVIVGYAYAGSYKNRSAYTWSVESTIYIRKDFHGQGLAKELYHSLFAILRDQGVVNIIAGISLPNEASIGLHESLGFVKVAHLKDIGFKFNKWWDVGYWQLQLQKPIRPQCLQDYKILAE